MKNIIEASTISRSQSEASTSSTKSRLLLGTTTKFDSLFPILDQVCLNSRIPLFLCYLEGIYFYYQMIFSSLYPFNEYWFKISEFSDQSLIKALTYLEKIAWFFHIEDEDSKLGRSNGETDLFVPGIIILVFFIISTFFMLLEIFGSIRHHKVRKILFFIIRFILDIVSPILIIPTSAVIGNSIRNLVLSGDKLNWIYLVFGVIIYICFIFYTFISYMLLNSSICISLTLFTSYIMKVPVLLPIISSLFNILQCVLSLFDGWAMIIAQLCHICISIYVTYPAYYMIFHTKVANIAFIGVNLSTWINDIIFTILYFVESNIDPSDSGLDFFHLAGFILPLASLIISFVLSSIFVILRIKRKVAQLGEFVHQCSADPNASETSEPEPTPKNQISVNSLKNERFALMVIHLSFVNALPLFYVPLNLTFIASHCPTKNVISVICQFLAFFPGESRQLNNYLKVIMKNRDLNYSQRFLMYQVYRFKMLRQSSVSSDANHRLAELKSMSTQCYEDIISFWSATTTNVSLLEMIANQNKTINMKWDESIREYPNNQKFSDEYCSYLVECQMDLQRAIIMKYRSNFIEVGKNFTIDVPFIRFAMCLPVYLKEKIVDFQGTFKRVQKEENINPNFSMSSNQSSASNASSGSSGAGNSSFSASMLSSNALDPELEENIGRQLLRQMNLRMEMNRALGDRKSYASKLLLYTSIFTFLVGFGFFLGVYIYSTNYIDYRSDACYYMNLASKTSTYLHMAILGSTLKFSYFADRLTKTDFLNELVARDEKENNIQKYPGGYDQSTLQIDDQISYSVIHSNSMLSMDYFHEFLVQLSNLANVYGENIYEFGYLLMSNEVSFISCFDAFPVKAVNTSIKALESYMFLVTEQSASKDVVEEDWYNSNEICEMLANQPLFSESMLQLFSSLMSHEIKQCEDENKIIHILQIVFPIVLFLLEFVPSMIFTYLFIRDTNKMLELLKNINPRTKEEAKKPIRKDNFYEISQTTEKKLKNSNWILIKVILFILSAGSAIIIYFMLSETDVLNSQIKSMVKWDLLSAARMTSCIESLNYILNAVLLDKNSSLNISILNTVATKDKMLQLASGKLTQLEMENEYLLKGIGGSDPCYRFDDELDALNLLPVCEVENNTDMHDSYRCCSVSTSVGIFITMTKSILDDIEKFDGQLDDDTILHIIHLLNNHLFARLERAVDRITEMNQQHCKDLSNQTLIIFIVSIIVTILLFVVIFFFYQKSVSIYHVGMILIQRLPPNAFISEKKLLNFVMNRKDSQEESEMSTMQSVIYMSLDAIVCTNVSGVVEIINPAVTNTFGYTPDQMLGQHISAIFSNYNDQMTNNANNGNNNKNQHNDDVNETKCFGDAEKITTQLELMSNGQSALVFEDHFVCMTDDAKEMPCGVTILGMTSGQKVSSEDENNTNTKSNAKVESFVVILRDETQLMEQQKEAEEAKAQSENLLYQILPRDIVARINSGEKDISFTVQSASIIFTDVVRFSEYASTLTPPEIMGSLSTMFAAFDTSAKKYKLLNKIKLIGDIYMAAAGLFAEEDTPPSAHAEEILRFGLDCLTELEDVNLKLNANLQLRVGINSGGPLLAGVLGTDKPVFDIIGDPINVAARLQTTDIPGKIQIPKSTYDLVSEQDFTIEERGEVFLKGKGKTMAYLVSPTTSLNNNESFLAGSAIRLV